MSKIGYIRQDDSSHNYLVPEDVIDHFDKVVELSYEDDNWDTFEELFGKYRIDGISNLKILIEDE